MEEEAKETKGLQTEGQEKGSTPTTKEEKTPPQSVQLTAAQYNAILDRMEEQDRMIEQMSSTKEKGKSKQSNDQDLDELAREGKKEKETEKEVDWDSLSNKDLVSVIFQQMNEYIVQPMSVQIQTLKVMNEIDKVAVKYDDFYDFQDKVREIAIENPTLSIEKAYKMAKLEAEEESGSRRKTKEREGGEELEPERKTSTIKRKGMNLLIPNRPTLGERPGISGSATRLGPAKTTKEAAERAWDEVVGKGGGGA